MSIPSNLPKGWLNVVQERLESVLEYLTLIHLSFLQINVSLVRQIDTMAKHRWNEKINNSFRSLSFVWMRSYGFSFVEFHSQVEVKKFQKSYSIDDWIIWSSLGKMCQLDTKDGWESSQFLWPLLTNVDSWDSRRCS